MDKRGISDVVTAVLIVLIALGAVVLVWSLIKPVLQDTSSNIQSEQFSANYEIYPNYLFSRNNNGNRTIQLTVIKKSSENSAGYNIILYDSKGNSKSIEFKGAEAAVNTLESKLHIIDYDSLGLFDIVKIEIQPILVVNKKERGSNLKFELQSDKDTVLNRQIDTLGDPNGYNNGILDNGEQCDLTNLPETRCSGLGYAGGALSCSSSSGYDLSECLINLNSTGLVLYYRLDNVTGLENDTHIYDWSGNENNGSVYGILNLSNNGKVGKAYDFDGTGGYIQTSFAALKNNFTIAVWFSRKGNGINDNTITPIYGESDSNNRLNLLYLNDYILNGFHTSSVSCEAGTPNNLDPNLYHAIWTKVNSTFFKLYVNGANVNNCTTAGDVANVNADFGIIGYLNYQEVEYYFNGTIDELMIFNRSLSSSEITALYNSYS